MVKDAKNFLKHLLESGCVETLAKHATFEIKTDVETGKKIRIWFPLDPALHGDVLVEQLG